jgi:hypothetical protein
MNSHPRQLRSTHLPFRLVGRDIRHDHLTSVVYIRRVHANGCKAHVMFFNRDSHSTIRLTAINERGHQRRCPVSGTFISYYFL